MQKETNRESNQRIDRREFLLRFGKYSLAASTVLAGSGLFSGCKLISGLIGDLVGGEEGSSVKKAIEVALGVWIVVNLADGDDVYYTFTVDSAGDYRFDVLMEESSEGSGMWSLYDADTNEVAYSPLFTDYWLDGWTDLETGQYYLKFSAEEDTGALQFQFKVEEAGESYSDSSYSDSSYSDSSYSDYSNYSDYSRWADAYSDWSNYSNAWYNSW